MSSVKSREVEGSAGSAAELQRLSDPFSGASRATERIGSKTCLGIAPCARSGFGSLGRPKAHRLGETTAAVLPIIASLHDPDDTANGRSKRANREILEERRYADRDVWLTIEQCLATVIANRGSGANG
jgi:hypothetical protein